MGEGEAIGVIDSLSCLYISESWGRELPGEHLPVTCLLFQLFSMFIAKGVTIIEVAVELTARQR